jgi:hypothetical protein
MPSPQDYKMLTREELDEILDSPGDTYEPRGLFVCWDQVDGQDVWTAVNNINGDAVTDEFIDRRSAVRWLHGYPVLDRHRWMHGCIETVDKARRLAELAEKTNK